MQFLCLLFLGLWRNDHAQFHQLCIVFGGRLLQLVIGFQALPQHLSVSHIVNLYDVLTVDHAEEGIRILHCRKIETVHLIHLVSFPQL